MSNLWTNYSTNVEFAVIGIILSLAIFTGVWSGVLSVAPIGFASFAAFIVTNIDNRYQQIHYLLPIIGAAIGLVLSLLIAPIFPQFRLNAEKVGDSSDRKVNKKRKAGIKN